MGFPPDKSFSLSKTERDSLSPKIIYFYKQLPAQPLNLFDLLFFELQAVRSEIGLIAFPCGYSKWFNRIASSFICFCCQCFAAECPNQSFGNCMRRVGDCGVFQTIFTWFDTMVMTRIDYKLSLASSAALWHRVLHFPSSVFRQHASGDIAMRINSCLGMQQFFRTIAQVQ